MHLETSRLVLRPLMLEDIDWLHALCTEPGVRKYLFDNEMTSRATIETIVKNSMHSFETSGFGFYGVFHKAAKTSIGFCGFRVSEHFPEIEIAYGLAEHYWGLGLMPEAAAAGLKSLQEKPTISGVIALVNLDNVSSQRVLEKLGMRCEKQVRLNSQELLYYSL